MWEAWLNDIVDTKEEVVENVDQGKTIEDYKNMLIRSFKEVHRVLKDECFFSLVFSYSLPLMWRVVQEASFNADFKSDFNIITVSSKSKTAVQSVSLKAQQRFFIITFKKSNMHMRPLKKCPDFNEYITKNIKDFLSSRPESTYDKIYDYLIKKCWKDGVLIENFDLAKVLTTLQV
jgi:adenine-specific DNA methylase